MFPLLEPLKIMGVFQLLPNELALLELLIPSARCSSLSAITFSGSSPELSPYASNSGLSKSPLFGMDSSKPLEEPKEDPSASSPFAPKPEIESIHTLLPVPDVKKAPPFLVFAVYFTLLLFECPSFDVALFATFPLPLTLSPSCPLPSILLCFGYALNIVNEFRIGFPLSGIFPVQLVVTFGRRIAEKPWGSSSDWGAIWVGGTFNEQLCSFSFILADSWALLELHILLVKFSLISCSSP